MRRILRLTLLTCLAAAVSLGSGCNILSVPFYLLGPEERIDAGIQKLGSKDKDKPAKVLIWTWSDRSAFNLEIPSADRRLAQKLEEQLKPRCQENKDYVTVVPYRMAEQFRNGRDDIDPVVAGKHFKADYVIYLEVNQFSMKVNRSLDQLLMGHANIGITLYDLTKEDDAKKSVPFDCTFPPESKGGMQVVETGDQGNSSRMFAESFLNYVSQELAWKFTAHKREEDNQVH